MILSFELPFALIPLLKFSSGSTKMGPYKNSIFVSSRTFYVLFNFLFLVCSVIIYILSYHIFALQIIVISWIFGLGIIGINVYYLTTAFIGWLIHNDLPKVGNVFIGIIVFPLMAIYILSIIYLTFRKNTVVIYSEPEKNDPIVQA